MFVFFVSCIQGFLQKYKLFFCVCLVLSAKGRETGEANHRGQQFEESELSVRYPPKIDAPHLFPWKPLKQSHVVAPPSNPPTPASETPACLRSAVVQLAGFFLVFIFLTLPPLIPPPVTRDVWKRGSSAKRISPEIRKRKRMAALSCGCRPHAVVIFRSVRSFRELLCKDVFPLPEARLCYSSFFSIYSAISPYAGDSYPLNAPPPHLQPCSQMTPECCCSFLLLSLSLISQ